MTETPENIEKPKGRARNKDVAKFPPLKKSKNIKEIDELLASAKTLEVIKEEVLTRFGERYSLKTYSKRRIKLDAMAKRTRQVETRDRNLQKEIDKIGYELTTLGEAAHAVMTLAPESSDPMYNTIKAFQTQVASLLRRASELYNDFDHLGNLRYALNTMQLRIAKMFELELQMGMILKDNTYNLETFVDMIDKSVKIHQSLGLKPKFGDPVLNLHVNVGQGGTANVNTELQSERFNRLKAKSEELAKLPPEKREEARKAMLKELFDRAQEAKFTEIPNENVDKPGV